MRPAQQNRRMRGRGNNNNNNRKGPNPLSRNYESNGPDVKIRGNAQHIAEKYAALARDAQVSGDRVMAENYLQHAEHYNRIILAAMAQNPVPFQREENFSDELGEDEEGGFAPNGAVQQQQVNGHGPQPVIDGTPAEVVFGDDANEQQPRSDYRQPRDGRDQRQPRDNRDQRQPREARQYRDDREPREGYEPREGREDRPQRDGREQRRFGRDRRPQRERFGGAEERNDQVPTEQPVTPDVAEVVAAPVAVEEVAAPKVEAPQVEAAAEAAAPKAPTRGRPRRVAASVEAPAQTEAAPVEAKAAPEAPAAEEEAPKRRPGRPRRTATKDVNEEA